MNSLNDTTKFDKELISTILKAQTERRNEQRQAVISANPWILQAVKSIRESQKGESK
jgi:hypothetical protein